MVPLDELDSWKLREHRCDELERILVCTPFQQELEAVALGKLLLQVLKGAETLHLTSNHNSHLVT